MFMFPLMGTNWDIVICILLIFNLVFRIFGCSSVMIFWSSVNVHARQRRDGVCGDTPLSHLESSTLYKE